MVPNSRWEGSVEPDYFQFYLRRPPAEEASAVVTDRGYWDRLWTDGRFVYVGMYRKFGTTHVSVELVGGRPNEPSDEWQHVAEVSLEEPGPLEILNWEPGDPVAAISLPAEAVRIRVLWAGLVSGRFEGLDERGDSDERIAIEVWPERPTASTVVRRWDGWPW